MDLLKNTNFAFDSNDVMDEFEYFQGKTYCYGYVTNDLERAFARFCVDMGIHTPQINDAPRTQKGELAIFSHSIYAPENSLLKGRDVYQRMIEQLSFWGCHFIYGFIDCRGNPNKETQLIRFYESFDMLGPVRILGRNDSFVIKEQRIL